MRPRRWTARAPCALLASLAVLAWPAAVAAQADTPEPQAAPASPPPARAPPPPPPSGAAPEPAPPPPPAAAPVPQPPPVRPALPPGDWVYTQQYGWIWMSYGDAYTYVPPGGAGEPLEYVYVRPYGWRWVVAPWVWGVGPWPHFGPRGPVAFGWYRHGWWRTPGRWRFRAAPPRGDVAAHAHGVRPAPRRERREEREHRGDRHR